MRYKLDPITGQVIKSESDKAKLTEKPWNPADYIKTPPSEDSYQNLRNIMSPKKDPLSVIRPEEFKMLPQDDKVDLPIRDEETNPEMSQLNEEMQKYPEDSAERSSMEEQYRELYKLMKGKNG